MTYSSLPHISLAWYFTASGPIYWLAQCHWRHPGGYIDLSWDTIKTENRNNAVNAHIHGTVNVVIWKNSLPLAVQAVVTLTIPGKFRQTNIFVPVYVWYWLSSVPPAILRVSMKFISGCCAKIFCFSISVYIVHTEAKTKWPSFCRRYFQIHPLVWKLLYFIFWFYFH